MPGRVRLTDADIADLKAYIRDGKLPAPLAGKKPAFRRSFLAKASDCEVEDGFLFHKGLRVLKQKKKEAAILKLWNDPVDGHVGPLRLYPKLQERYANITRADVESVLKRVEARQINAAQPKKTTTRPIIGKGPFRHVQVDLVDMGTQRGQSRYLMTCVDVFSRYALAVKLSRKDQAAERGRKIFEAIQALGFKVKVVQSDNGGEFVSGEFQELVEEFGAKHVTSLAYMPTSQAIVERFHGTLKRAIAATGERWDDVFESVLHGYNRTVHSTIGMTPEACIRLPESEWAAVSARIAKRAAKGVSADTRIFKPLKKGDRVRIAVTTLDSEQRALALSGFRKSTTGNWSEDVAIVKGRRAPKSTLSKVESYSLIDEDGDPISGNFRRDELLLIEGRVIRKAREVPRSPKPKPKPKEPAVAKPRPQRRKKVPAKLLE